MGRRKTMGKNNVFGTLGRKNIGKRNVSGALGQKMLKKKIRMHVFCHGGKNLQKAC